MPGHADEKNRKAVRFNVSEHTNKQTNKQAEKAFYRIDEIHGSISKKNKAIFRLVLLRIRPMMTSFLVKQLSSIRIEFTVVNI